MRTTKPISTVSYNSIEFLHLKLTELTRAKRISFWAFIWHQAEDDEQGLKDHIHVYIEPAKMLQTEDLRDELKEFDPTNPKPLGCLSFTSSKFDHWYMYALHDRRYLAMKGQSRKFVYSHDCFVSSDSDDLLHKARSIDLIGMSPYGAMQDAIEHGLTFQEFFSRGTVPLPQLRAFQLAWDLLSSTATIRNGRPGHDQIPDTPPPGW